MKNIIILSILIALFSNHAQSQNLIVNGDFENGPVQLCSCPSGFLCSNDAGRVVDGRNPLFVAGKMGCITDTTDYTNSLGAHGGTGYVYFYAGADYIQSRPNISFAKDTDLIISVWYCGPQGAGAPGQNTPSAHFSFGVDFYHVSNDVAVPDNTPWTLFTDTVRVTAGSHHFDILSGDPAQYSFWFDDFTVTYLNSIAVVPPVAALQVNDTDICAYDCVLFTDLSSNNPTSWQWSFPGGTPSSSTLRNPTVCYTNGGNYNVVLTATNSGGSSTATISNYIHVKAAPPVPSLIQSGDTLFCSYDSSQFSYQWYFSDTLIINATRSFYVASNTGNYNLKVTNVDSCSVGAGINVVHEGVFSYNDFNAYFDINPNPVSNELKLQWKNNFDKKNTLVSIYTIPGSTVISVDPQKTTTDVIDVSSLSPGVYFVKVQNEKGRWVGKFIKN